MEKAGRNLVILEIILLVIINVILGNNILEGMFIIFEFMVIRTILGAKHYDNQIQCLIMTSILLTSIFMVLKINFWLAILMTIIEAFILSNQNIDIEKLKEFVNNCLTEGFMYKQKSKYHNIDDYIAKYPNSKKIKIFEQKLRESTDKRLYPIYKVRFYEKTKKGKAVPLSYVSEKTGVEERRVVECLNSIQTCFEIYCSEEVIENNDDKRKLIQK